MDGSMTLTDCKTLQQHLGQRKFTSKNLVTAAKPGLCFVFECSLDNDGKQLVHVAQNKLLLAFRMATVGLYGYAKLLIGVFVGRCFYNTNNNNMILLLGRAPAEVDMPSMTSVATFSARFTLNQLQRTTPAELYASMVRVL
jgi:hypothetical protein